MFDFHCYVRAPLKAWSHGPHMHNDAPRRQIHDMEFWNFRNFTFFGPLSLFSYFELIDKQHKQFGNAQTIIGKACTATVALKSSWGHKLNVGVTSWCQQLTGTVNTSTKRLATQILATKHPQESNKSYSLVLFTTCSIGSLTNQIQVTTRVRSLNYDFMRSMIS